MDQISSWLAGLGLEQYVDAFVANDVDIALLASLTADDLKEIGVASVGHRRKLLDAIAALHAEAPAGAPASVAFDAMRRQTTVLFADLSGFTSLTKARDAEETHALLNVFFDAVDGVVTRYEGRVDKHIGDAVMAVFGAPVAHTDDPERALRAALDIHAAVAALEPPLAVHIGVASGQVVASSTGSEAHVEYTVTGDSVNLASRLTDLAAAGETYASESVQRALGERFIGENLGPRAIEGLAEPMVVWRLTEVASGAGARTHRFVGRARELGKFAGAFDSCGASASGEVFVLRGEPGIGKTRLLEEIAGLAKGRGFAVHRCLVLDFGAGKGQTPIHALVRSLLDIEFGSEETGRAEAAEAAFAKGWLGEAHKVHLNNLLDLDQVGGLGESYASMDNASRVRGRQRVVAELVAARCRETPLLIEIEDVHWAAPDVLAHLAHLAAAITDAPCVLVMTTRIAGDPVDDAWRAEAQGVPITTIDLGPLRADEARSLASDFTAVDAALLETCVARADGNPLFLEQLLRNLDELSADNLPGTIQGIVQARLDVLDADSRSALQAASALGQRFSLDALSFVLGKEGVDPSALLRVALLRPAGADFHFAHALIRDGAYESMLKPRRLELHQRAAEWFADQDPTLHARHLDLAEDASAAEAYLSAARRQEEMYQFDQALLLAERALELDCPDPIRFDLICTRGDLLRAIGRSVDAMDTFKTAAVSAGNDVQTCRAHTGLAQAARQASRYDDALQSLDIAESSAKRLNEVSELANIHYLRGNIYFPLGRIDKCLESNELAIKFAREAGSTRLEVGALSGFGDANYLRGTMLTADRYYSEAIDLARAKDLSRDLAANLHNRSIARLFSGKVPASQEDGEESLELARGLFIPITEAVALVALNWSHIVADNLDQAKTVVEKGLRISIEIGAKRFEAQGKSDLARTMFLLGDHAAARDLAAQAVDVSLEFARNFSAPKCLSTLALSTEDPDDQDRLLDQGIEILSEGCVSHCHFFLYSDAIAIMLARRDWDGAERHADALEDFTRAEPLPFFAQTIRQGRLLAQIGRQGLDSSLEEELDAFRRDCARLGVKRMLSGLYDKLPELDPVKNETHG
jgi:class 3 adenylate cyclase/tetratricopeptide (TPR) repeat protein